MIIKKHTSGQFYDHNFSKEEEYYEQLDDSDDSINSDDSDDENKLSRSSGLEDILFKMPRVQKPLMGSPKQVQPSLDLMALEIQRNPDSKRSEELYNTIFLYMHGYLINVALKQFPYIKGMQTSDIFQQALIALRFKAIPNFKTEIGRASCRERV